MEQNFNFEILSFKAHYSKKTSRVELDFKNRQDKNQLGFKNQITNDQLVQISFKNHQDKNILTLTAEPIVVPNPQMDHIWDLIDITLWNNNLL